MTFKQALKELKKDPRNGLYYIQGHLRWLIHGKAIKQYYKKSKECPECFHLNQCEKCGCDFNALALSSKSCKPKELSTEEKLAYIENLEKEEEEITNTQYQIVKRDKSGKLPKDFKAEGVIETEEQMLSIFEKDFELPKVKSKQ